MIHRPFLVIFGHDGLVLGRSQSLMLSQLPIMSLASKVVKITKNNPHAICLNL